MKKGLFLAAAMMAATLGGCSEYDRSDRTLAGAGIGAAAGGIIGGAATGTWGGAAAGAAIGGVGGAVIGDATTPRRHCRYVDRRGYCHR
ncbi:MAG: glycine zipper domain-containing protein [Pseudomonadota bacterium]